MNTSIFSKKHNKNIFFEKLVNELYSCIENHPHVIHPANVKDSLFVKINCTIVKKQKHLLQTSVRDIQNDIILTISEGAFLVQEKWMGKYVLEILHIWIT